MVISRYNYWSILVHICIKKVTLVVLEKTELKCWLPKKTPNLQFESVYLYRTDGSQNKLIREKGHNVYLSALTFMFCRALFLFCFLFSFLEEEGRLTLRANTVYCKYLLR